MSPKLLFLIMAVLGRSLTGADPIDDPYEAAVVASEVTGLDDVVVDPSGEGMGGTKWLVATGITGSRLVDLRTRDRRRYSGTAIHTPDARKGRNNYKSAVSSGALDPAGCVWHRDDGSVDVGGERRWGAWSTRGPYETMVHDKHRHLEPYIGTECFPIELFDVPLFAAIVAAEHAKATCERHNRRGRRGHACDWKFLRCIWAGIGSCQDPSFRKRALDKFRPRLRQARRILIQEGDLRPRRHRHDDEGTFPRPVDRE